MIYRDFYFFTAKYNAANQPIPVQPNSQLYMRTHAVIVLFFFVWRANHAGAKAIDTITIIANAYFIHKKIRPDQFIVFKF